MKLPCECSFGSSVVVFCFRVNCAQQDNLIFGELQPLDTANRAKNRIFNSKTEKIIIPNEKIYKKG